MSSLISRVRAHFGLLLHEHVAAHAREYSLKVGDTSDGSATRAVRARHQEAEVLEQFLMQNPVAGLLTPEEHQAAQAHIAYLRSALPPEYLGGNIRVDARAAMALERAMANASIEVTEAAPWGPRVLEKRLLLLGFPRAVQVEEG